MSQPYLPFSDASFGEHRKPLRSGPADDGVISRVVGLARRLWPRNTAFHLASRADVTPRAAENWLAEATGMSADALAGLLRSDAGLAVLEQVMGDAVPVWWADLRRHARLVELERRQQEHRRLLDELLRESADAAAAGGPAHLGGRPGAVDFGMAGGTGSQPVERST